MSILRVDISVLGHAAGDLDSAAPSSVRDAGAPAPGDSAAGDPDLAAALAGMSSAWERGVQALSTDTERTADGLRVSALRYQETDLALQSATDRLRSGLPG